MEISLVKASIEDCDEIHRLQVIAFEELYKKYNDTSTSPAAEDVETIVCRMEQPFTDYYFIKLGVTNIGAVRVKRRTDHCTISPIFIIPEYCNKGYGRETILQLERLYPHINNWQLGTILEEEKLCHFYEKLGYRRTGTETHIKEGMTAIGYEKIIK